MKKPIALITSIVTAASCAFAFSSCGDDRLYMPDLSGIDFTKATEQFDFLELTINAEAQSSTVIKGKIMEQSIRPGAKISSGQNVQLTISSGEDAPHVYKDGVDTGELAEVTTTADIPEITTTGEITTEPATTTMGADQFEMPNFRGMLLSEAVEKYSDVINFQIKEYASDSDLKPGQIIRQDVTEGKICDKGTTLYVTIASGAFEGGYLEQQPTTQPLTDEYGNPVYNSDAYQGNAYGDPYNNGYTNGYGDPYANGNGYDPYGNNGNGYDNGYGNQYGGNGYDNGYGNDQYGNAYGNGNGYDNGYGNNQYSYGDPYAYGNNNNNYGW